MNKVNTRDTQRAVAMDKQAVIGALSAFARQRSGIEYGNYGDPVSFRAEQRSITRDLQHARTLLSAVSWRDSITGDMIAEAAKHAYSGRLTITERDDVIVIDYCTGQYFPTEYRRAVCAVLASVLWGYFRASMPAPTGKVTRVSGTGAFRHESEHDSINGMSPGDYLRATARREFGRGIAQRWFN